MDQVRELYAEYARLEAMDVASANASDIQRAWQLSRTLERIAQDAAADADLFAVMPCLVRFCQGRRATERREV